MAKSYLDKLYESFGKLFVRTINGQKPDEAGGVSIDTGVMTVDGKTGVVNLSNTYQPKGNYLTSAPVTSVNNKTGAVTIDVGVTSINGKTGDVTLNAGGEYTLPPATDKVLGGVKTGSNITNTDGTISLTKSNVTSALGYTPLQNAPVSSVNGKTGAVTVDVGVASFNGKTGAVTYTAPVTSVNGKTGAVTIDATNKSGNRGTLNGYNTLSSTDTALTISESSSDDSVVTSAVSVYIANGYAGQSWTKTVALKDESATVKLSSLWEWIDGEVPTIKANSILVVKWCGSFGIASLIAGE